MDCLDVILARLAAFDAKLAENEKGIYISASEVISRFSIQREGHKTAPY